MGWNDVVGHDHLVRWFQRQILSNRLAHAYLFEGPAGVGKKHLALALAGAVNCETEGQASCGRCSSCVRIAATDADSLILYQDIGDGLWIPRSRLSEVAGSEERLLEAYETLAEWGFLNPPVPRGTGVGLWDRVVLSPEKLFRRDGSFLPQRALEEISEMAGDHPDPAGDVGAALFRLPRSLVLYRNSLGIDRVTPRGRSNEIRTVRGFLARKRLSGRRKTVILDDVQKMTEEAQNCLLKTLEEPPDDSLIILILDRTWDVLPTIRSRCQQVHFGTIPIDRLADALEERGFARDEARWSAERSGGCFSQALQNRRQEFLEARREMLHTWGEICEGGISGLLGEVGALGHEEISERGARVRRVRRRLDDLMLWVRDLLLVAEGVSPTLLFHGDLGATMEDERRRLSPDQLRRVFWTLADTRRQLDRNVDVRLALEGMALVLARAVGAPVPERAIGRSGDRAR